MFARVPPLRGPARRHRTKEKEPSHSGGDDRILVGREGVADLKIGLCVRRRTQDGGRKPPLHGEWELRGKMQGAKRDLSLRRLRSK